MALRATVLLATLACLSACDARDRAVDIELDMPDGVRPLVDQVLVDVYAETCAGALHSSFTIRRDGVTGTLPLLGPGTWCIVAQALDTSCLTIARGEVQTTLPRNDGDTLVIPLYEVSPAECVSRRCSAGSCVREPDGGPDASAPDAGCTPTGELSNCIDDDCDGVVDDGVDPVVDRTACGAQRTMCDDAENGFGECRDCACRIVCADGFQDCDAAPGCETPENSSSACGACDNACPPDEPHCVGGGASGFGCLCNCPSGQECCDGAPFGECIDVLSDPDHCGACGAPCLDPSLWAARHATRVTCNAGVCSATCESPWLDCNGAADGCEVNPTSPTTCGGCAGEDCTAEAPGPRALMWRCTSGRCELVCQSAWLDCDPLEPGCETPRNLDPNCRSCGDDCPPGFTCDAFGSGCLPDMV